MDTDLSVAKKPNSLGVFVRLRDALDFPWRIFLIRIIDIGEQDIPMKVISKK
jgi:hypothetical protein